ncbi:MAG: hypothetical protein J0H73_04045 [Salana multivorans]|uniref:hypothetical protein n=1 Tax=Salana multivorans TaxID=120377 RepID=UPI000962955C|nr:hypothetical protein [Salana multivorans]MBN8881469.1 hypothetical protein [Salana multivorans]OJX93984.1 MAG: hypothetical protein BGO96_09165 [Micrococcales bacterium 73-15]
MPYLAHPRWAAVGLYLLRAVLYLALLLMGAGAVWLTPQTIGAQMPAFITDAWGTLAILGALGCLYGSLTRRYRLELVALPLLIGAVIVYAISIWGIVVDAPTRTAQASAITALVIALGIRWVDLLVVRGRLRREHDRHVEAAG